MSRKLIPIALTILSGTALAWAAACSSTPASNGSSGGGSSSSSSSGGGSSGSSGSSSGSGSSSSSGAGSSSGGASHDAGGGCTAVATQTLIDDMSAAMGVGVAFPAPACGAKGSWFDYATTGGTIGNPPNAPVNPPVAMTFSPLPSGLPADAGVPASGGDGGGPKAACISGATGSSAYSTEGMGLNFAITPNPDGGNGTPVPIDASSHTGIQFWAWGGTDAGMQSVIVNVPDRNETPGLGVCDPTNTSTTACGGATHTVTIGPGWQLIQVAFATIADNMYYGGGNEMMLDPSSLTQIQWQVQLVSPDGGAPVPFNFCVYDVSFY